MIQIPVTQVTQWAEQQAVDHPDTTPIVLDVREAWEVQTASIAGDEAANGFKLVHMPMRSVPARYMEMDRTQPVACLCHHGARSRQVAHFLMQNGFSNVVNIQGGIHAWAVDHDPRVPLY